MLYFEDFRIGDVRSVGDVEMREDEIIAFARQWDPQPWHVDPDAAARSPMRGITASSAHTFAVAAKLLNRLPTASPRCGTRSNCRRRCDPAIVSRSP